MSIPEVGVPPSIILSQFSGWLCSRTKADSCWKWSGRSIQGVVGAGSDYIDINTCFRLNRSWFCSFLLCVCVCVCKLLRALSVVESWRMLFPALSYEGAGSIPLTRWSFLGSHLMWYKQSDCHKLYESVSRADLIESSDVRGWILSGLCPGVKRPGRGVDHPPPSSSITSLNRVLPDKLTGS